MTQMNLFIQHLSFSIVQMKIHIYIYIYIYILYANFDN